MAFIHPIYHPKFLWLRWNSGNAVPRRERWTSVALKICNHINTGQSPPRSPTFRETMEGFFVGRSLVSNSSSETIGRFQQIWLIPTPRRNWNLETLKPDYFLVNANRLVINILHSLWGGIVTTERALTSLSISYFYHYYLGFKVLEVSRFQTLQWAVWWCHIKAYFYEAPLVSV